MSVSWRRSRFRRQRSRSMLPAGTRPLLHHVENWWNEEDSNRTGSDHSPDDRGAHDLTRDGTGAGRGPERNASQDKGKRSHQDRPKAEPGAFQGGVSQRLALFGLILGELDNQNGVFGGEANQHDQTDLRVDVVFNLDQVRWVEDADQKAAQPQHSKRAEDCDGRTEQNAERQRPAFIERGQDQENE